MYDVSIGRIRRPISKGGTRQSYEKRRTEGSSPKCPHCGVSYDLSELSLVEVMEATEGILLCETCKETL